MADQIVNQILEKINFNYTCNQSPAYLESGDAD